MSSSKRNNPSASNSNTPDNSSDKKTRTRFTTSLSQRIVAAYGMEYIRNILQSARTTAVEVNNTQSITELLRIDPLPQGFRQHFVARDDRTLQEQIPDCICLETGNTPSGRYPSAGNIRLNTQKAMANMRINGIPEEDIIHTASGKNSSVSLDLHRLAAWERAGWDPRYIDSNEDAIHSCHNKACFRHVYFGTKDLNRATDFCDAYTIVGGFMVIHTCKHNVKCLRAGQRAAIRQPDHVNQ